MAHNDAGGWYTQAGDTWASVPLGATCAQSFSQLSCAVPAGACSRLSTHEDVPPAAARRTTPELCLPKVVKGGVIVLPSGHTLNALVVRNTTEFCTYTGSGCTGILAPVRTIVYIFEAPYVGAVALLRGPQTIAVHRSGDRC